MVTQQEEKLLSGTGAGDEAGRGEGAGRGQGARAGAGAIELGEGEQKVARRTDTRLNDPVGKVTT